MKPPGQAVLEWTANARESLTPEVIPVNVNLAIYLLLGASLFVVTQTSCRGPEESASPQTSTDKPNTKSVWIVNETRSHRVLQYGKQRETIAPAAIVAIQLPVSEQLTIDSKITLHINEDGTFEEFDPESCLDKLGGEFLAKYGIPSSVDFACAIMRSGEQGLQFAEDGKDLLVSLTVLGPANRQVVLTDYLIWNGRPDPLAYIHGGDTTTHPPMVRLNYLEIVNRDLPDFDWSLMAPGPSIEERRRRQQTISWRLKNFRNYNFERKDVTFRVKGTKFMARTVQLRKLLPGLKELIEKREERVKRALKSGKPPL